MRDARNTKHQAGKMKRQPTRCIDSCWVDEMEMGSSLSVNVDSAEENG